MKNAMRWLFAGVIATAVSIGSALAYSNTYTTAAWNGSSAYTAQWTLTTSAATDITGTVGVYQTASYSGSGLNFVLVGNQTVFITTVNSHPNPGWHYSSATVYDVPAATFTIKHVVSGAPTNTTYGDIQTTLSW